MQVIQDFVSLKLRDTGTTKMVALKSETTATRVAQSFQSQSSAQSTLELLNQVAVEKYHLQSPRFRSMVSINSPNLALFQSLDQLPVKTIRHKPIMSILTALKGNFEAECDICFHQVSQKRNMEKHRIACLKKTRHKFPLLTLDGLNFSCQFGCQTKSNDY